MRPLSRVKEELGLWSELLERKEQDKRLYDGLFSALNQGDFPLSPENQAGIAELKQTFYLLLLCDLGKCYCKTERFQDGEKVLLEAWSLGCKGAGVLLFYLYGEWMVDNPKARDWLDDAFERVKNVEFFSKTVTKQINNDAIQSDVERCRVYMLKTQ